MRALQKHATGKLLDCGCGTMPYYLVYKNLVEGIYAVDWDSSLHDIKFADKVVDLNESIPYPTATFNTVLLADVLEHLQAPARLMTEIYRVLNKSGKLICFVPFMYWVHENPHDYFRYTEFALRKLCQDSHLKILELKPYGGGPDIVLDVINKLSRKRPRLSNLIYRFSIVISHRKWYRKLKNKTARKLPLGYVLVAQK